MAMRQLFCIVLLINSLIAFCDQNYLIIKNGYRQGLADSEGKQLIPPVYDKIGWTDGNMEPVGDMVGYKQNGKWGLISVKNKKITEPEFFHISVFDSLHIKAAIKGKFTNKLFYGLIDVEGQTVVSCNYFDIQKLGNGFNVLSYESGRTRTGFLNENYTLTIPIRYEWIEWVDRDLYAARDNRGKWSFFNQSKEGISVTFDEYEVLPNGIKVKKNGMYGILDRDGTTIIESIKFKEIHWEDGWKKENFDTWEVLTSSLDSANVIDGDSIEIDGDLFITYLNGNQEVVLSGIDLFGDRNIELKMAKAGYLIIKDIDNQKWTLSKTDGKVVIGGADSIAFDNLYFYALSDSKWDIYNRFGRKLNLKPYESISTSRENMILTRKNGYWGLLDFQGNAITSWKYDLIGQSASGRIAVKYLGEWGLIDLFGNWILKPDADTLIIGEHGILTISNSISKVYDVQGGFKFESTNRLIPRADHFIFNTSDTTFGIYSDSGNLILSSIYSKVGKIGNMYFGIIDGVCYAANSSGKMLLGYDDFVSTLSGYSEEFYRIYKDGKTGFVDDNGKLRIANRYDSATLFSESFCAVKLRGNWGYIDKSEVLRIQPIYSVAGEFDNGLAVVKYQEKYGIIDTDGKWVAKPRFNNIDHRQGGLYILTDEHGKVGVADRNGNFLLSPQYEDIFEAYDLLVLKKNGKMGIMDRGGNIRIPFEYEHILIEGDYFVMKKLVDN